MGSGFWSRMSTTLVRLHRRSSQSDLSRHPPRSIGALKVALVPADTACMRRLSRFRPSGLGRPLTLLRAFLVASAVILAVGAVTLSSQLSDDLRVASLADTADAPRPMSDAVLAPRLVRRQTQSRRRHAGCEPSCERIELPAEMHGLNVYARDGRLVFSTTHPRPHRSPPFEARRPQGGPSPRTKPRATLVDPAGSAPRSSGCGLAVCTAARGRPVGRGRGHALDASVCEPTRSQSARWTVWYAVGIVFAGPLARALRSS